MKKKITKKLFQDLWIALRPLSLTLSLASTTLGILMAHRQQPLFSVDPLMDLLKVLLVTFAGMCVLGSANLINDFYEGSFKYHRPGEKTYRFLKYERTAFDLLVFAFSMLCIMATGIIGLILMKWSTPKLAYIGLVGMLGAYAYTGEPFVYKRKGLGAILSLILVGSLMVQGSYMVFMKQFSWAPMLYTLPAGLMIPLMMFSNEIRDYQRDKDLGIKTFTVLMGKTAGKAAYIGLLILAYGLTLLLIIQGNLPVWSLSIFTTLPLAVHAYRTVSQKTSGIRVTNWLHIAFNLLFILSLLLP